jgi:hypothetical protein
MGRSRKWTTPTESKFSTNDESIGSLKTPMKVYHYPAAHQTAVRRVTRIVGDIASIGGSAVQEEPNAPI